MDLPPGILNIDKPGGITSRTVIDHVERITRPVRAGHAGTLDPLARGVVVVCVGKATRLIAYIQRMTKRYRGEFLLGRESDTEDITGQVKELADPPLPDDDAIRQAATAMIGRSQQQPPAYSALKVAGQRAYKLARQGKEVALRPREITIYGLEVLEYDYPRLVLDIECSGGTYVRSLGRDLARRLGTEAVMSALTRTAVGVFTLEDAIDPAELTAANLEGCLAPLSAAVAELPRVELSSEQLAAVARGQKISLDVSMERGPAEPREPNQRDSAPPAGQEVAALGADGALAAILAPARGGLWRPAKNFCAIDG